MRAAAGRMSGFRSRSVDWTRAALKRRRRAFRRHFSSDWDEAWLGNEDELRIEVSAEASYTSDGGVTWHSAWQQRQHLFRATWTHDTGTSSAAALHSRYRCAPMRRNVPRGALTREGLPNLLRGKRNSRNPAACETHAPPGAGDVRLSLRGNWFGRGSDWDAPIAVVFVDDRHTPESPDERIDPE